MTETLLDLKLTPEDAGVLVRSLEIRLENLRFELARTEDHDYRADLRHQLDRLEAIYRDLESLERPKKSA